MFFPRLNRKIANIAVEQLDATITGADQGLIFVALRPSHIVKGILGSEPIGNAIKINISG